MGYVFFVIHDGRGLYSRGHGCLGCCGRQSGLASHSCEVGIHDDLAVVAEVHRFELVELLPPLLHMCLVGFVALQIIARAEMHKDLAVRIGGQNL